MQAIFTIVLFPYCTVLVNIHKGTSLSPFP